MTEQQWYALRQRHGKTKQFMAALVWTSARTIERYESGKKSDPARFELAAWKLDDADALRQVAEHQEVAA